MGDVYINPKIKILMATYNGEKYLKEQIDSILKQTYQNYTLFIADDHSTDQTWEMLKNYQKRFPQKIKCIRNIENSGSAKFNFFRLMETQKDAYIMLSDQDDLWFPTKIEMTLHKMLQTEERLGKETPVLIHTDLKVVDQNLAEIAPSYEKYLNTNYERNALHYLLAQNVVTGCTVMYNAALASLINTLPTHYVMHDWWIALIASAFGKIDILRVQTILYRQHENNSLGAKDVRSLSYLIGKLKKIQDYHHSLQESYSQAKSFYEIFYDRLNTEQRDLLFNYYNLPINRKIKKLQKVVFYRYFKCGFIRNLAYLIFI